ATATELAGDLRHFLEDRPIEARPPSWLQRVRKWVRRHRGVVATAITGASVMVLLGVAGLSLGTILISRERTQAPRQPDEARDQRQLARQAVDSMYTEVAEKWLANQPDMQGLQRQFLEKALHFYEQFAEATASDPNARVEKAKAYQRVAELNRKLGRQDPAF